LATDGLKLGDWPVTSLTVLAKLWLLLHSKARMIIVVGSKANIEVELKGGGKYDVR